MTINELLKLRLFNHHIISSDFKSPDEAVSWFGAMQAQEYNNVKWALGLRLNNITDEDVEQSIIEKNIIRTWLMRGTLHISAAKDVRWMLKLFSLQNIRASKGRNKQLGLTDKTIKKSCDIFAEKLDKDKILSRDNMLSTLRKTGISTEGQRGYHLLWQAAQAGIICFGPMQGKQQTFVLLDEWVGKSKIISRDESLSELASRYFESHGPATLQDFSWWSGLNAAESLAALETIKPKLINFIIDEQTYWTFPFKQYEFPKKSNVYLLPGFDEFILGYKDHYISLEKKYFSRAVSSNGIFFPTIVSDGRVIGTWKKILKKESIIIKLDPFEPLTKKEIAELKKSGENYSEFYKMKISFSNI